MRFSTNVRCAAAAVAIALVQGSASAGAQVAAPNQPSRSRQWVMDIEAAPVRHTGGGKNQDGLNLGQTGATAAIGISRLTDRGAGIRLSLRGFGVPDISKSQPDLYYPGVLDIEGAAGSTRAIVPSGAFVVAGPSIDVESGIASEGLPLGIEVGPDVFRTLARPHAGSESLPAITILGLHSTVLLAPMRRSRWRVTGGAQWLSGNIVTWMFPFGARYSF